MNPEALIRNHGVAGAPAAAFNLLGNPAGTIGNYVMDHYIRDPSSGQLFPQGLISATSPADFTRRAVLGGVTAPLENQATRMVTGGHPVYQGESDMMPHVVDVFDSVGNKIKTTPVYSSFKKALDVAKNYLDIPNGGRAFPRYVGQ